MGSVLSFFQLAQPAAEWGCTPSITLTFCTIQEIIENLSWRWIAESWWYCRHRWDVGGGGGGGCVSAWSHSRHLKQNRNSSVAVMRLWHNEQEWVTMIRAEAFVLCESHLISRHVLISHLQPHFNRWSLCEIELLSYGNQAKWVHQSCVISEDAGKNSHIGSDALVSYSHWRCWFLRDLVWLESSRKLVCCTLSIPSCY